MTESFDVRAGRAPAGERRITRCRWCGASFAQTPGPGRPRRYCRKSHRQRAYEARRLAEAHRLGPDDVLVSRESFQGFKDLLFRIEAALQDVDQDLADGVEPAEYRRALWHLYQAAAEVRVASLEPRAVGTGRSSADDA